MLESTPYNYHFTLPFPDIFSQVDTSIEAFAVYGRISLALTKQLLEDQAVIEVSPVSSSCNLCTVLIWCVVVG
jgi:hypothetical protein